jgi:hypothetical protein
LTARALPIRALIICVLIVMLAAAAVASAQTDPRGPGRGQLGPDESSAGEQVPRLEARAILGADASAPAPFPATPNTNPVPARGSRQPVGGFSALTGARGRDSFWAMPDNGFGSKANSRSFLLRVYRVRADFETAQGGRGGVDIRDWITLRDPSGNVPFDIVRENTRTRLLTGGDFDIESMRQDARGDLWFGEEFGPFILHTDSTGRVLEAPIPLPDVKSPDYPADYPAPFEGPANLGRSSGFEGMALSEDGRRLLPVLEGAVAGDDARVRRMYEYDIRRGRYTAARREYRVADPSYLVSDFTVLGRDRYIALERDNFEGTKAVHKRGFVVDLRATKRDGSVAKREVIDLLDLADPAEISLPGRPGDIGLGDPFAMPYVTIESVLPLGDDRLAIVNDTNFGSRGRNPDLPDYSDFIVASVPRLPEPERERDTLTLAVIGDTPYGDAQVADFPDLVDAVNRDRAVRRVIHLGDIKSGSSTCTDERFRSVFALYEMFDDPFLFTPGDNDWTDCHRANNGGFDPLERLAALRRVAYPVPGRSRGGRSVSVRTQADDPPNQEFVENQLWSQREVVFSLVHVVGSNNDLAPWFGADETPEQRARRLAEFERREQANLAWLERSFEVAERRDAPAVVVGMQADTFFPGGARDGFAAVVERLSELSAEFGKPVLLLQGDTHDYLTDRPIADAPNLTRIVVEGETADEWLRLRVDPSSAGVFSWTRERGF